ncbi:hypothetical protein MHUMG1_07980 [Metarhizium humberi]|uniref:Microbial-type PARG catalytic domain-containing protein n=1 Tax=Metarhizium humberi TaxID=2596975 RepID=A0A9P8M5V8_9HYPO|nr:hypothetical protein MHUMG1_07980 [Metarhizium humberi]
MGSSESRATTPPVSRTQQRARVPRPQNSAVPNSNNKAMQQREILRETARETLAAVHSVQSQLPSVDLGMSTKYSFNSLRRLGPNQGVGLPQRTTIQVVNEDTLNAATKLSASARAHGSRPPIVVNFANARTPGGGWLNGAVAQEEAICYRSSLAISLNPHHYPLAADEGIYSPSVLVLRGDMASGHQLLVPQTPLADLPLVSAVTISAIRQPAVRTFQLGRGAARLPAHQQVQRVYARDRDRSLTKAKMRLALRMAALHGHDMLVLGAFGCGVFGNPPDDVAHCWLEVLREHEFTGNRWREVWFAVFDPDNRGNFETFRQVLSGKKV